MIDAAADPIRHARTRKFLRTHLVLCLLGLVVGIYQAVADDTPGPTRWLPLTGSSTAGLLTAVVFAVFRARGALPWLIPSLLAVDSAVVLAMVFVQGEVETPWSGIAVLILIMMPLFSGGQRAVWWLAGFQIALFATLMWLRSQELIPVVVRTGDFARDTAWVIDSVLYFAIAAAGAAILAGRTSVDVLNSQRQLQSEVDQATRGLQAAQARLVQQEKMVSLAQLTAGMAHEINNPLAFAQTNLRSLERDMSDILKLQKEYDEALTDLQGTDPEKYKQLRKRRRALHMDDPEATLGELVRDAHDGLHRVQSIIQDLKTFARLDEAPFKTIDAESLASGIDSTLKMMQHRLTGHCEVAVSHGANASLEGSPALLNQVVMNLVQNAAEAAPREGGRIRISTQNEGAAVVIEVADNGPGIPPDLRSRVFDPFFTTKRVGEGTGLGLSLSYQIVERHGGRIEIATAAEGGAILRVVLPGGRAS